MISLVLFISLLVNFSLLIEGIVTSIKTDFRVKISKEIPLPSPFLVLIWNYDVAQIFYLFQFFFVLFFFTEGVASGKDALSLLDNPKTRNIFIDDLLEVMRFKKSGVDRGVISPRKGQYCISTL